MKRNIVLLHPTTKYAPLGSLYLANELRRNDIKTQLFPVTVDESRLEECLKSTNPLAVGMSVITSKEIIDFIDKSKLIKKHNIPVIWGGVHSSLNAEQCINEEYIDTVVTGQAEEMFPKVIDSLPHSKQIIVGGIGDLDNYSPDWSHVDLNKLIFSEEHSVHSREKIVLDRQSGNRKANVFYYLITSRGCPYKCSFCSENLDSLNPSWNAHSSDYVKREISFLQKSLQGKGTKLDGIGFWDDMFWKDKKRSIEIIDFMHSNDLGYLIEARASQLLKNDAELFRRLSETGCLQVFVGAESADQVTLDNIGKGNNVEDYKTLVDLSNEYQLPTRFSFIVGFPEEKDESIIKTLDFAEQISKNPYISISGPKVFTPYPKTKEYSKALEQGFIEPTTTSGWSDIHRNPRDIENNYPWIRKLNTDTIRRLKDL